MEQPGDSTLSREVPDSGLVRDTGKEFLSEVGADPDRASLSQVRPTGGGSLSGVAVVTAMEAFEERMVAVYHDVWEERQLCFLWET